MKTITTNNRTLLFVEVPEDAGGFKITINTMGVKYSLRYSVRLSDFGRKTTYLPISDTICKFIATTDTIPADLGITDTLLAEHGITGRHAIIEVL